MAGLVCYIVLSYSFVYCIVFVAELPKYLPSLNALFPAETSINAPAITSATNAFLINTLLFLLFGLQHSGLSRVPVQRFLCSKVTKIGERILFVVSSILCLFFLIRFWQPIPNIVIWNFRGTFWELGLWGLYGVGVFYIIATLITSIYYDLFSMRTAFTGHRFPRVPVDVLPWVYKYIRQPLFFGFVLALWAAPEMTMSRLQFALGWTVYTSIGFYLQERDLAAQMEEYVYYQRKVPAVVPWPNEYVRLRNRGRSAK